MMMGFIIVKGNTLYRLTCILDNETIRKDGYLHLKKLHSSIKQVKKKIHQNPAVFAIGTMGLLEKKLRQIVNAKGPRVRKCLGRFLRHSYLSTKFNICAVLRK